MNYRKELSFDSAETELSKFADILKIPLSIPKSKNDYFTLDIGVSTKDGMTYESTNQDEFKQSINDNISRIKSIRIRYYSSGETFDFDYSYSWGTIRIILKSKEKSRILTWEDEINKIFKNSGLNWLAHKSLLALLTIVPFQILVYILLILLNLNSITTPFYKISLGSIILTLAPILIWVPLMWNIKDRYPRLVISTPSGNSGRTLKSDFKYILIGIPTALILGIVENKLSK